ncbi:enoyl-CoA hydratase/carnithine racemase [Caldalkalibacillus uzonensis]|uniref:Enoyl-CoA hydratase/carnithine racemase n=1 Tax=Caldalkalibacillus uzonensis TaxID=353224 RepID=A0ABU0CRD1_9BACI|nr:enoyl-CoA hydratase-related protein [Caldalkalibacillus uzonensis]MDQ0338980.1 enoyl-CoA hydratase/carnithine racemase [Caldalkalibacillus uzonensis]
MECIRVEKEGAKAVINLNRPDQLNALNYQTLCELGEVLEQLHTDRSVRCVLLRGEGKAFCVGADLKERKSLTEDEVRRNVYKIRTVCDQLEALPQPTLAVLHGYAFGGGLELSLACDFRYAQTETKLGLTEVSLGIIPGAGGTIRLPKLIGKAKAKELILMAKRFDAREGERIGLLNGVSDDVWSLALEQASQLEDMAPLAVIQAKHAIDHGFDVDRATGMAIESKAYEVLIPTEDRLEALRAFSEKRKPQFKGR